jgi:hypothetical protein
MDQAGNIELGEGGLSPVCAYESMKSRLSPGASELYKGSSRSNISGKVWSVYLSKADRQDKALAENWMGDTEGILIFVCLRFLFAHLSLPDCC